MRVLHVIDHLGQGGAQRGVTDLLLDENSSSEHAIYVLRAQSGEILGEHPKVFRSSSRSRFSLAPLFGLKRCIREFAPDILHCHLLRAQIFGRLAVCGSKRPFLIFHERGQILLDTPIATQALKLSSSRVQLFIAVSEAAKLVLEKKLALQDTKSVEVLYNGIKIQSLIRDSKSSPPPETLGSNEEFIVCYAGRLEHEKGCDVFLQALAQLKLPFRAVVLGDGTKRAELETLASHLDLGSRLSFLGAKASALPHIKSASLLVLPSRSEAFPRSAMEAMALGVPVVATRVGGVPELIVDSESGLLVPPEDPDALAKAMEEVALNKDLAVELSIAGQKRIEKFAFESQRNSLEQLYQSLLRD